VLHGCKTLVENAIDCFFALYKISVIKDCIAGKLKRVIKIKLSKSVAAQLYFVNAAGWSERKGSQYGISAMDKKIRDPEFFVGKLGLTIVT